MAALRNSNGRTAAREATLRTSRTSQTSKHGAPRAVSQPEVHAVGTWDRGDGRPRAATTQSINAARL